MIRRADKAVGMLGCLSVTCEVDVSCARFKNDEARLGENVSISESDVSIGISTTEQM
jgi:hypothetical protein